MNVVHRDIIVSHAAIPNSAVALGSSPTTRICAYADPAPLSPQEAQHFAMLLTPDSPVETASISPLPVRVKESKGGRLYIRC